MRLLLLCLLIYVGYKVLKAFASPRKPLRPSPTQSEGGDVTRIDDVMVKDPVCGTYIPKREGLRLLVHGEAVYFCGPACRTKYLENAGSESE